MKFPPLFCVGACLALGPLGAFANVQMPAIFGDHMVLQQGLKLSVWGTADPAEVVSVSISGHKATTTADQSGHWRVNLDPLPASTKGAAMHVAGAANALDFQDVLVGDVWVCSGQSNMEFGIGNASNAAEAEASANQPDIRLFLVTKKTSLTPLPDCEGKWVVCTPETVAQGGWKGFSAVGYFFGKDIEENRKVPVGLIGTYWGGTPAQAWTDLDALKSSPDLKGLAETAIYDADHMAEMKQNYEQQSLPAWQKAHDAWVAEHGAAQSGALVQWEKDVAQAKAAGQPLPAKPTPPKPEPRKPRPPGDNPGLPTSLFNAMIHPLIPYGIKGVIWYQGEANAGNVASAKQYAVLFPAMISGWRRDWGIGDFPFLYVQLAGWGPGAAWPVLRDSQTKTLSLPDTGMAVALDLGNRTNIHPTDKADVGNRLALAARHVAYGEDLVYSGPTYAGMKPDGPNIKVSFHHEGKGLVIGASPAPGADGNAAKPADQLEGFEVAGADGNFVPASAKIEGEDVIVTATGVTAPSTVRYGWQAYPEVNLYNKEGLPAVPFSSESTPILP